jgi:hypothetical protein
MQEGKIYRLRADKIYPATYDAWGRFKSVATGAETFLKAEYLIRDMSEGD